MTHKNEKKPGLRRVLTGILAALLVLLMILPMVTMAIGSAGAVTQSEIDALEEQQKESQARQDELNDRLDALADDKAAAQEKRQILEQQLTAIKTELDSIEAQIAYYDAAITQKEAERVEAVAREEAQYELFCERVRAMEEDGDVSYWSIIFQATDFADLLDRITIVDEIMAYDQQVMDDLVATRKRIEELKAELESDRAEQQVKKAEQEAKKAEQEEKIAEAQALLDQINADTEEVNRQLEAESKAAAEIQAEIVAKQKELEEQRKQNNVVLNTGSGYYWPLPGNYKLTSAFGYRIHPITGQPHSHTGIDIPAPGGTPIYAAKGGQVVTSAYHSSYGNYVVIDHGNGNSTLYAHMSSRAVSAGQIVSQGDVIGYVGSTGSSTGNHLHLEVRVNYQRVDPESCFPGLYNSFIRAYNW
ncbi:peptidoglycan DD-metalloendopeptidase family protein [Pseudoflavonifractor phocaeensis]|uniref:murein hydrolase activator EnvC family protein n=1 Tax=Pseudoflavonifractor phocaeensis TaxID=1870988 RepID=UPI00195AF5CA|nr:peptidoglycan DD-metalloendopeptidase family protein [Pseudoflavonifractor phocaeensis]MBM6938624.1 peptidoglycan DD-metalloendopeptidase family protein [Pseudoflavonifractor phocaeensis]